MWKSRVKFGAIDFLGRVPKCLCAHLMREIMGAFDLELADPNSQLVGKCRKLEAQLTTYCVRPRRLLCRKQTAEFRTGASCMGGSRTAYNDFPTLRREMLKITGGGGGEGGGVCGVENAG